MPTECFKEVGAPRLLQLAEILDAADAEHEMRGEPRYAQHKWVHPCGTPACAMGHWAASEEGSKRWGLSVGRGITGLVFARDPTHRMRYEFCLTHDESDDLFGGHGCGNALTAKQAAEYIRNFVFRKLQCRWWEAPL